MKNSRILLLLAATVMSATITAVNLEEYLIQNKVDAEGKTFWHKLAENCDNDEFQIEFKPFNGIAEKLALEAKNLREEAEVLSILPEEMRNVVILARVVQVLTAKDNNGDAALDILKRKNAVPNPCDRCLLGEQLLQQFHNFAEEMNK